MCICIYIYTYIYIHTYTTNNTYYYIILYHIIYIVPRSRRANRYHDWGGIVADALLTTIESPPTPTIMAPVWHTFWGGTYESALRSPHHISYRVLCSGGGGWNSGSQLLHAFPVSMFLALCIIFIFTIFLYSSFSSFFFFSYVLCFLLVVPFLLFLPVPCQ